MKYISKETIRLLSPTLSNLGAFADKSPTEYLAESRKAAQTKTSFDVFLSHSYLDKDTIARVHAWLSRRNLSVYVDWISDQGIGRPAVTKDTAQTIRRRMLQSKSLLYCFSENAKNSRWMPWELGFFDGARTDYPIHLLPIAETSTSTEGVEFAEIYPVVEGPSVLMELTGTAGLYVRNAEGSRISLVEAIKG